MRQPKPYWKKSHQCWYANLNGRTVRLGKDEAEAMQKYHELMAAGQAIRLDTTVQALIGLFLEWTKQNRLEGTYGWYSWHLSSFGHFIGPKLTLDKLKPFHVTRWIESEYKDGSDTYKHGAIRTVVRVCNWAVKQGYLLVSPVAGVERPTPRHRDRIVTDEEWQKLIAAVKDAQFRDVLMFIRLTGCRPQEVRSVEAMYFVKTDPPHFLFPIDKSKGKKRCRYLPLPKAAEEIVRPLMLKHPDGPIFRNLRGNPWTKNAICCRFDRLDKKLGFRICLYSIRHTWATRALENGVDIATVAAIMGHKDATTLMRVYSHVGHNRQRLHEKAQEAIGDEAQVLGMASEGPTKAEAGSAA